LTILLFFTTSVSFADRSPSPEAASNWGFFQIALLAGNLAFNLSIFVYTLGKLLWTKVLTFLKSRKTLISSSIRSSKSKTVKILACPAPQQSHIDLTHNQSMQTNINISSLDILLPADNSLGKTTLPSSKLALKEQH
jgi:hypothetical protein